MADRPIIAANVAAYTPIIWAKDVLSDAQKVLVIGSLFDRRFETFARSGGNGIEVPNLADISPNVVNTMTDMVFYDAIQNNTRIDIDKKYDIAISVSDIEQIQNNPSYWSFVKEKLVYGLAKQIDTNCAVQFRTTGTNTSYTVGTVGVALTEDNFIAAYEKLNIENAPFEGRQWALNPASITDIAKNDYFIRMDYVPDSMVRNGFQGKQIFGSPVYMTNNLDGYATGKPAAYFQQEYAALVIQQEAKFETWRWHLRHADALSGLVLFGVKIMRPSFCVCINTRA